MLQWITKVGQILTAGAVLSIVFVTPGNCQSTSSPEEASESEETIEEIVVYGNKSLVHLHLEVYKAQDVIFDLFNTLNSDDDFDIRCYKEAPTGSHIKRRVCKTNYARRLEAEEARRWLRSAQTGIEQPYLGPGPRVREMDELLQEEMTKLVNENPELLEAVNEYRKAQQTHDSERKRRCEGRILFCRR